MKSLYAIIFTLIISNQLLGQSSEVLVDISQVLSANAYNANDISGVGVLVGEKKQELIQLSTDSFNMDYLGFKFKPMGKTQLFNDELHFDFVDGGQLGVSVNLRLCEKKVCRQQSISKLKENKYSTFVASGLLEFELSGSPCKNSPKCSLRLPSWRLLQLVKLGQFAPMPSNLIALVVKQEVFFIDAETRRVWWQATLPRAADFEALGGFIRAKMLRVSGNIVLSFAHGDLVMDFIQDDVYVVSDKGIFKGNKGLGDLSSCEFNTEIFVMTQASGQPKNNPLWVDDDIIVWPNGILPFSFTKILAQKGPFFISLPITVESLSFKNDVVSNIRYLYLLGKKSNADSNLISLLAYSLEKDNLRLLNEQQLGNDSVNQTYLIGENVYQVNDKAIKLRKDDQLVGTSIEFNRVILPQFYGSGVLVRDQNANGCFLRLYSRHASHPTSFAELGRIEKCADHYSIVDLGDRLSMVTQYSNLISISTYSKPTK